jgi:hypothetical protein
VEFLCFGGIAVAHGSVGARGIGRSSVSVD